MEGRKRKSKEGERKKALEGQRKRIKNQRKIREKKKTNLCTNLKYINAGNAAMP